MFDKKVRQRGFAQNFRQKICLANNVRLKVEEESILKSNIDKKFDSDKNFQQKIYSTKTFRQKMFNQNRPKNTSSTKHNQHKCSPKNITAKNMFHKNDRGKIYSTKNIRQKFFDKNISIRNVWPDLIDKNHFELDFFKNFEYFRARGLYRLIYKTFQYKNFQTL